MPDCLMPPPSIFLNLRALVINFFVPITIEPDGQDSPLDKQQDRLSTFSTNLSTGSFRAIDALNILAPSRCIFNAWGLTASFTSLKYLTGIAEP